MHLRKLACMAMAACAVALPAQAVEQGDRAPAWRGADFSGAPVAFPAALGGEPAVVVFWATWCGYCKAFMPYLEEIQADYGGTVKIIAINAKEDGEGDPKAYVETLGFPMIAVRDGDAIADAYDVEYIPGLMIVDGNGMVAWRRAWTDLPAGQAVAELWAGQVRAQLDGLLD